MNDEPQGADRHTKALARTRAVLAQGSMLKQAPEFGIPGTAIGESGFSGS
jgi:hypothetical protein